MKLLRITILPYLLLILFGCGLFSCNTTKFVPEGEYLLDKVIIKSDSSDFKREDLDVLVRQMPNYKMFWFNKTTLQIYNLAGKKDNWLNRQLKSFGEPPVIFDSTAVAKTNSEFRKFFINKGYMNVEVSSNVDLYDKKAEVTYLIHPNVPYKINEYKVDIQDSVVYKELYGYNNAPQKIMGEGEDLRTPLVKKDMLFDRNVLGEERNRITNLLRNRGYYNFENSYISYEAETDSTHNEVNLELQLHPYPEVLPNGAFTELPHRRYYFNKTYVYTNYDPLKYTNILDYRLTDSVTLNDYVVYFHGESPPIRPSVLKSNSYLTPGRLYAQFREEATYSAYSTLQAFNNVNIHFEEFQRNDSSFLDSYILTMPAKKQSTIFSIEGTNTAGDLGFASSMNYTHRNIFKGSETFNFKVRGAYEAISQLDNAYLELGAEAAIRLPKFMFPFLDENFKRKIRTSTEFSLSYNYQTRPEYSRTLLSGGVRYIWHSRGVGTNRHQFDLLNINYVFLPRLDSAFISRLHPSAKYFGYVNQFIVGMGYYFSKSTFNPAQKQRDVYSLRYGVESSGNLLYGLNNLLHSKKDQKGAYELFGIYYAQFLKGDIDYSNTTFIDKNNAISWRIGGGIGVPYGNSKVLPFEKRYYSGGANSVRAWAVRELGPGSYQPNEGTTFYQQSGDIKLDMNIEYRSRFFWKMEAAAFIDAGNIWTIRNYEDQQGGQFRLDSFYKEIALGYGLGLRLDFDYFLIRFDCGWKAYNPANKDKDRWTILHPNFGNNWAWHVAVGYPF